MSKPPYRPLNLQSTEISSLKTLLEGVLTAEAYYIKNSHVGKFGENHIRNILTKIERLIEKDQK